MKPETRIKELLSDLVERVEECRHCGGTGREYPHHTDACATCGGTGKTLDATALVQEIEEINEIINPA